jgi:serine protease Do
MIGAETRRDRSSSRFPSAAIAAAALLLACSRQPLGPQSESRRAATPDVAAGEARENELGRNLSDLTSDVAKRALPAVVSVASTRVQDMPPRESPDLGEDFPWRFFAPPGSPLPGPLPSPFPPREPPVQRGLGSGVLVAKDVILTNAHVVEDAREIVVTAGDKRVLDVKLVGSDPKSDLAVLRVTSDTQGLTPLEFATSSQAHLGQIVLAIGYPFGLSGTVTMGIVSATGRANLGIVDYEDFLQTDAAINPGNSGGALIDLNGRLVGIPTAILSRSGGNMGVGFAIPSDMARPIMNSLLEHGTVSRGFLGVTIQDLDPDLSRALGLSGNDGVLISDVSPGTPAEEAGLQRGDVVISVDGQKVDSTGEFRNHIAAAGAKRVELEVVRNGRHERVHANLTLAPNEKGGREAATGHESASAGLQLAPLDAAARARLEVPASIKTGAVVNAVEPGGPASEAGLQPGDVIVEANRASVSGPRAFAELWSKAKQPLALLVWRSGRSFYAVLKP